MREIFTDPDFIKVGFYHSILEAEGIACFIRHEGRTDIISGLPDPVMTPSLCITNNDDYDRAMSLIADADDAPETKLPDWKCAKCNEEVPGNFQVCWKCGASTASQDQ